MPRNVLGLTLAALLTATIALAQTGEHRGVGKGADGGVDLTRFQERQRDRLMRADTDHDGRIGRAEFLAWRGAHPGTERADGGRPDPETRFRRLDANGDGVLAPDEIDAASAKRFARLDADHDGSVSRDERHAARRP